MKPDLNWPADQTVQDAQVESVAGMAGRPGGYAMKKAFAVVAAVAAISWANCGFANMEAGEKPGWGEAGMCGGIKFSADQKAKMKDIMEQRAKDMKPLKEALKLKIDELRILLDKKAPDDQLVGKLAEVSQAREAVRSARKKWMDKCSEVLTPTQRAEMVVNMEGKKGMGPRKGMKMKMGGKHGSPEEVGKPEEK
jgi:Spy/CpxP family protein refolding chaperone